MTMFQTFQVSSNYFRQSDKSNAIMLDVADLNLIKDFLSEEETEAKK